VDAGTLNIRACHDGRRLTGIAVELRRPAVSRLFVGQEPAAVLRTVPHLYSLCARAQQAAAGVAMAAATGQEAPPAAAADLWLEFLHESLWRLLLDWPVALGLAPEQAAFVAWRAARQQPGRVAATRALVDGPLATLAEKCLSRLVDRDSADYAGLPTLTPAAWLPHWREGLGAPPSCPRPASVAAAYRDRLAGVRAAVAALAADAPCPVSGAGGAGWGVGQALTARGVLTHALRIEEGRVSKYFVWAPTDRHFADGSGLAALLAGVPAEDAKSARRVLEQAVLALDPCLPYVVNIADA
jgi:hypothetical protein